MELYNLTAVELSEKLKNKEVSAVEITKSFIDRIDKVDGKINSFITKTYDNALNTAKIVDDKIKSGQEIPAISGIPIGIKDNICTSGVKTTAASKMLHNFVPPYNATVVEKINSYNMPVLGKLNMDEFAMGSSTESSFFGKTRNPLDLDRVPGGSSGGSSAAVASLQLPFALGSDTGGSIRQPASYTGLVGLKPTYGAISRYGLIAYASSFDTISPIARSVTDLAFLFENLVGRDKKDITSVIRDYKKYTDTLKEPSINGLKIGVPKEFFGEGVENEIKENIYAQIEKLEKNGAKIIEISLPLVEHSLAVYYVIATAQSASNLGRIDGVSYGYRTKEYTDLNDMYTKSRSEGFGEEVKRRILLGTHVLLAENADKYYNNAVIIQNKIKQEFLNIFEKVDMLITPTTPTTAFKFGENISPLQMYAADICTISANITGIPALSIPSGVDKNGLPIGMQFIAPHFREDVLFNAAKYFENIRTDFNINIKV